MKIVVHIAGKGNLRQNHLYHTALAMAADFPGNEYYLVSHHALENGAGFKHISVPDIHAGSFIKKILAKRKIENIIRKLNPGHVITDLEGLKIKTRASIYLNANSLKDPKRWTNIYQPFNIESSLATTVVYHGLNRNIRPIGYTDSLSVKTEATAGVDYFLFYYTVKSAAVAVNVLKAFTIFKKWQKSGIKLLMLSENAHLTFDKLQTYALKDDVRFVVKTAANYEKLISAGFAALAFHSPQDDFGLNALQAQIPLIGGEALQGIFNGAAVYAQNDPQSIAEAMIRIYKDEYLQAELKAHIPAVLQPYNYHTSAAIIMDALHNH